MTSTPLPNQAMEGGDLDALGTLTSLQTSLGFDGAEGQAIDLSVANESMQQELTCPVCNIGYELPLQEMARDRRPRVLPCLHTACGQCLETLAKEDFKKKTIKCPRCPGSTLTCGGCNKGVGYAPKMPESLRCPICRREASIPGGNIMSFKPNLKIMKLMEMVKLRADYGEGNLTCIGCNEGAKCKCVECDENYCQKHSDFHERSRATCDHHLINIVDILESQQSYDILHRRHYCMTHPKELVNLYCTECEKAVCPRCAIGNHKSHDVTSIEEVYEHIKVKMDELKKKTESKIYNLKQSIVKIKNAERESDVESLAAKRKIQDMTERCINFLKEREIDLANQVNQRCSANDDVMKIQLNQIEENLNMLNEGQNFVKTAFANWTEAEIVAIEDQLVAKLEELAEIEVHKHTYPLSRTDFEAAGLKELADTVAGLGNVEAEDRVRQSISNLGHVPASREATRESIKRK